ncbi:hypothetical protein [Streptomyces sp. NPDC004296]|uniref:hypothetical protein n=1 Tax=Streptomyces sp. NPDC004296 TaxID=3364697 RepID=UPI00367B5EB5
MARDNDKSPNGMWPHYARLEKALAQLETRWDSALSRVSQHDRLTVGPDRCERSFWTRQVLRADRAGADRCVIVYRIDKPGCPLPALRILRGCQLAKEVRDQAAGLIVAELQFERPLQRGEMAVTEFELHHRPPRPLATFYERVLRHPTREYVVEVEFASAALPASCEQYLASESDDIADNSRPVALDRSQRAHAVILDAKPCRYGLRWMWPEPEVRSRRRRVPSRQ